MSSSRMYTWPAWSQQAQHVCFVCMNERQNTADLIYLVFPVFFSPQLCLLVSSGFPCVTYTSVAKRLQPLLSRMYFVVSAAGSKTEAVNVARRRMGIHGLY